MGSLFDGSGTCPLTATMCGIKPVWASEIEKFPIEVTTKRFPNMKHSGDITKINGAEIEPVDIITFGSPCFPADTMVLTDNGYLPIKDIKVGDMVFTHKSRWRKVTEVGWKTAETYKLKGNISIETTAEHPIYGGDIIIDYSTKSDGKRSGKKVGIKNIDWIPAKHMQGKQWATPCSIELLPIPKGISDNKRQKDMPELNQDFWYFVGRWLGDGWVNNNQRYNRPEGQKRVKYFFVIH